MPLYDATVPQTLKMLKNLSQWLDKAATHAEAKSFDVSVLLSARLAPDQYPLLKQIQGACDAAKFAAARIAGKEPPKHPDTEQTWEEIRGRINNVIGYLEGFQPEDFAGADERIVPITFLPGKGAKAGVYLNGMALPNFYFHIVTAYAILRHNGVDIGKRDFIGGFELVDL
ncbi:MAG: DUF1993 domain-containing protein [Polyangiaceae bacterium]|nr:DUF1993 domain-containing protein [Myxococcales bacterium]MCB9584682.1 DUF1993 domain-containing protein [Polyangiaceae bacterium]MCB9609119.1 DUF1993 domain-containing protein [Polyangiaceae bacterium]